MMTAHLLPNEDMIKKGDDDYFSLVSRSSEDCYRSYEVVDLIIVRYYVHSSLKVIFP